MGWLGQHAFPPPRRPGRAYPGVECVMPLDALYFVS